MPPFLDADPTKRADCASERDHGWPVGCPLNLAWLQSESSGWVDELCKQTWAPDESRVVAVKVLCVLSTVALKSTYLLPYMIRTASASLNANSSLRALLRLPIVPSHPLSTASDPSVSLQRRRLPKDGEKSSLASTRSRQPVIEETGRPRRRSTPQSRSAKRVEGSRTPLLTPHMLGRRLMRMCTDGNLDEAVTYLQSMPLDAQNVQVWTILISGALRAERYQLAYRLYIDVRSLF